MCDAWFYRGLCGVCVCVRVRVCRREGNGVLFSFVLSSHCVQVKSVAVLAIVILTVVNCCNVSYGTIVQNILAVLKFGSMSLVIILAVANLIGGKGMETVEKNFSHPFRIQSLQDIFNGEQEVDIVELLFSVFSIFLNVGSATVASMWAYDGWMDITW